MKPVVMILAGGTGGHVFPALAVAEQWRARGLVVEWIGSATGIEARLVPAAGITLHTLPVRGLRGKGWRERLRALSLLLGATYRAWRLMRRDAVCLALGMGGYASGPAGLAARLAGVPLVIHEQNAAPGLSNRLLAHLASRVLTGFPQVLPGRHTVYVGNPVRAQILAVAPPQQRQRVRAGLHLLVLGGSQGAEALNVLVPQALTLLAQEQSLVVVHQCGERHVAATEQRYAALSGPVDVRGFIDDMAAAYADADLVICRAGALTIAELAAVGVASLLIPLPQAVDDHQRRNAEFLSQNGAAVLCPQQDLDVAGLLAALRPLCVAGRLSAMALQARQLARPQATQAVIEQCDEVMR